VKNTLHFAVTVGINRYPGMGKDLTLARGDAEAFAGWLLDPNGGNLPVENVKTLVIPDDEIPPSTAREDARPIRREVLNALGGYEANVLHHLGSHPEDWERTRLYFYVSGHGLAPGPKDAALLMADAGPRCYGENIACSALLKYFGETQPYKEVVIFADCCRDRIPGAPLGGVTWTVTKRDNGEVSTAFGCATEYGRSAFEAGPEVPDNPDELRGFYTQALLEGLKGAAIDTSTGNIDSNSLARYLRPRVRELTEKKPEPQKSTMEADPSEPIVFRSGLTEDDVPRHTITLKFDTEYVGPVELLRKGRDRIDQLRVSYVGQEWLVQLAFGMYQVVPTEHSAHSFQDQGRFTVIGAPKHVTL